MTLNKAPTNTVVSSLQARNNCIRGRFAQFLARRGVILESSDLARAINLARAAQNLPSLEIWTTLIKLLTQTNKVAQHWCDESEITPLRPQCVLDSSGAPPAFARTSHRINQYATHLHHLLCSNSSHCLVSNCQTSRHIVFTASISLLNFWSSTIHQSAGCSRNRELSIATNRSFTYLPMRNIAHECT